MRAERGAITGPYFSDGGPDRTRTCDLRFRKPLLYPAELRDQVVDNARKQSFDSSRILVVCYHFATQLFLRGAVGLAPP